MWYVVVGVEGVGWLGDDGNGVVVCVFVGCVFGVMGCVVDG